MSNLKNRDNICAVFSVLCSSNSMIMVKNSGASCIYYRSVIGDVQVVQVFRTKMKIVLRRRENPRVVKDLSNGDPLASRWDEQAVYQIPALDRCLVHSFFLNRCQAPVDLDHQPPSTFFRRRPFVAGTQEWKSTDGHSIQNDSSACHIV